MADPGWYDDPTGEKQLRYFDGQNWTQDVSPIMDNKNSDLSDIFGNSQNFTPVSREDDNSNIWQQNNSYQDEENLTEFQENIRVKKPHKIKNKVIPMVLILLLLVVVYGKISQDKAINKPINKAIVNSISNSSPDSQSNTNGEKQPKPVVNKPTEEVTVAPSESSPGIVSGDEVAILDKASMNFDRKIKGSGIILSHLNSGIYTEVTLNPNNTIYLKNSKGDGVGLGKYLYLKNSLYMAYDGSKNINKIIKQRGGEWVRVDLSNSQTGITFYSAKYYDGSNISKFWQYLKKYRSEVSSIANSDGSREIAVSSVGGNDWATFYIDKNGNFTKVSIDGDSDISSEIAVLKYGKKPVIIPTSKYIKF